MKIKIKNGGFSRSNFVEDNRRALNSLIISFNIVYTLNYVHIKFYRSNQTSLYVFQLSLT